MVLNYGVIDFDGHGHFLIERYCWRVDKTDSIAPWISVVYGINDLEKRLVFS